MVIDAEHHRRKVRELVQEPPDEPTYCELKRELAYTTKAEKAELVKDVVSFANAPLEHHGGFGYLIFGVAPDGSIPGVADPLPGDPPSAIRDLLNKYLERPVGFEFVTTDVEDGDAHERRLAAVVVPNSRRKPHMISRDFHEQLDKKTKYFLRKGEVWVRKAGGRQLATAEDMDAMYEAKLMGVARDAAEPLERRIEALERELGALRKASPVPKFGAASYDERSGELHALTSTKVLPAVEALFAKEELSELMKRPALVDER